MSVDVLKSLINNKRGIARLNRFMVELPVITGALPSFEEMQDIYSSGARPPSPELGVQSTLREGEQVTAEATDELGASVDVAGRAGTEGLETGTEALAKKAASEAVEEAGVKTLGKIALASGYLSDQPCQRIYKRLVTPTMPW